MLYQKYRPQKFDDIVGNKEIVASLKKVVSEKPSKQPHVFMLFGSTGCGKTTIARILAKELGCEEMSITEINSANTRGIDTVRDITESAALSPMFGKAKCYIVDESQQLTTPAQQAFLKVIEDVPPHTYFMFCTTDPSKIIPTVKNRCAKYQVSALRGSEMKELLFRVAGQEKIQLSDEVVSALVKAANGCPREGLTLLEQIQSIDNPVDAITYLSTAETVKKEVVELCRELISKRSGRWLNCVKLFKALDVDAETVRLSILGYLKNVILNAPDDLDSAGRMVEIITIFGKPTYSGGEAILVSQLFQACLID